MASFPARVIGYFQSLLEGHVFLLCSSIVATLGVSRACVCVSDGSLPSDWWHWLHSKPVGRSRVSVVFLPSSYIGC